VAEFMVFYGAWQFNKFLAIVAIIGIVFTAAYVLRVLQRCFWGPLKPNFADMPDARPVEILCLTILAAFIIGIGMIPGPLVKIINSGVGPVLTTIAKGSGQG
jgi:NADH-quinone oxidoreductase subunit M